MTQTKSKDGFLERITKWTLAFVDPNEEQEYREYIATHTMVPWGMKICTYVAVFLMLVNQVYNFIMVYGGFFVTRSTREVEICMACFAGTAFVVESAIGITKRGKCFQGFFLYTCMMIYAVTTAFITNKWPVFGIQYLLFPHHPIEAPSHCSFFRAVLPLSSTIGGQ
jgi:hypothetical protein